MVTYASWGDERMDLDTILKFMSNNIERISLGSRFHIDQACIIKVLLEQKSLGHLVIWTDDSELENVCKYLECSLFKVAPPGRDRLRIDLVIKCDTSIEAQDIIFHVTRVAHRLHLSHVQDFILVIQLTNGDNVSHSVDREMWQEHWQNYASIPASSSFEMYHDLDDLGLAIVNRGCSMTGSNGPFCFDTFMTNQLL